MKNIIKIEKAKFVGDYITKVNTMSIKAMLQIQKMQ